MSAPGNIPVTSLNALSSSIQNDGQVSRWFEFLVTRPGLRQSLSADSVLASCYKRVDNLRTIETTLVFLFASLILGARFWQPTLLFFLGLFLLWRYVATRTNKAQMIAQITLSLVSQDFPKDRLLVTSLYQLGEFYSERYHIPSLVDTIYFLDKVARWVILSALLITFYVIPLSFFWPPISAFIAAVLIDSLLKIDLIYKHL